MGGGKSAACDRLRRRRRLIDTVAVPDNSQILTLDVWDATAGQQLANRAVTRQQWKTSGNYEVFELPFTLPAAAAGHVLEMRTFFYAGAYVRVDKIGYY